VLHAQTWNRKSNASTCKQLAFVPFRRNGKTLEKRA
jgi:hypothetical protein